MNTIGQTVRARPRLFISILAGAGAGSALPSQWDTVTKLLIGWNVTVWSYLALVGWLMVRSTHVRVRSIAEQEDRGAGIILTIGMAVDSNVIIFERIREEIRSGKTIPSAVEQGFGHAFVTIIDTHVTTIVSSLFLYAFGAGPIRGFAVTLVLGLLVNLFSAVYVSRTIFIWLLSRKGKRVESLSI